MSFAEYIALYPLINPYYRALQNAETAELIFIRPIIPIGTPFIRSDPYHALVDKMERAKGIIPIAEQCQGNGMLSLRNIFQMQTVRRQHNSAHAFPIQGCRSEDLPKKTVTFVTVFFMALVSEEEPDKTEDFYFTRSRNSYKYEKAKKKVGR